MRALLCLLLIGSAGSFTLLRKTFDNNEDASGSTLEDEDLGIATLLERANRNLGEDLADPLVVEGDIALPYGLQNAAPCTYGGTCLWRKSKNGKVYVPYRISHQYSQSERNTIEDGLRSFTRSTCIRFVPHSSRRRRDFLDIQSRNGCYSYVGRHGGAQVVSLARHGCVYKSTIQHELLHALGFKHEHTRSDRDEHVRILLDNVEPGKKHNFRKAQTNNLGTPYDYSSVMHYGRYFFSSNGLPTIVPIPDPKVAIGGAKKMNANDILRVNRLYKCKIQLGEEETE